MGQIYWRADENAVLTNNPTMPNKEAAALVSALGFRECTPEDVKYRRRRMRREKAQGPKEDAWPSEVIVTLKKHWDAGLTPSKIATLMPAYSRSAIRAKGVRMGWVKPDWSGERAMTGARVGGRPPKKMIHAATSARAFQHGSGCVTTTAPKPPRDITTAGPTAESLNLRMWDQRFTSRCCKWATGEDEQGFLFCAAPRVDGLPYCRAHVAAAYRPSPPRPPSAVKDSGRTAAPKEDAEPKPLDFEKAA
jgi:GcrA cell cycle regulator